jgi:hypothetical protein
MRHRHLGSLAVVVLPALATAAALAWTIVPTPNKGSLSNGFNAVSVAPDGTTWAAGHWYDGPSAAYRTLAARWNGAQWSLVPTPNVGSGYNDLSGVAALSPDDAWAVGYSRAAQGGITRTLILHWTAGAWRVVAGPNPGASQNVLNAVYALAPDDVWAAGFFYDAQFHAQPLLVHWNGAQWTQVPAPPASATINVLQGLGASGPQDVWAVGRAYFNGRYGTMALHWDGAHWAIVPTPRPPGRVSQLRAVAAIAPDDAWAVGDSYGATVIQHWDGSAWSVVPGGEPAGGYKTLLGVAARAAGAVWAVGYRTDESGNVQVLIERWDGSGWRMQPAPAAPMPSLIGIAGGTSGPLWAVGMQSNGSADRTLAVRSDQ